MKQNKHVESITEQDLDLLLDRWRAWSQDKDNLGFKSRTIENRLMVEGANSSRGKGETIEDPGCEVLDSVISSMPEKMHKTIKLKYLYGWRNKDTAKKLKMTTSSFKIFLVRCRAWLCGRLSV